MDATTHESIVRKNLLTEKEQLIKDKLFKKGRGNSKGRPEPDEYRSRELAAAPQAKAAPVIDGQIDTFMNGMMNEVRKMNNGNNIANIKNRFQGICCIIRTRFLFRMLS